MELLLPILMFGLVYLMLVRPQQRRVRAQREMIAALQVGDEIVTVGGMLGRVVALEEDVVSVEAAPGVVMRFRRAAIGSRIMSAAEPPAGEGA